MVAIVPAGGGHVPALPDDVHIYPRPPGPEFRLQLAREPYPLPRLWLNPEVRNRPVTMDDIQLSVRLPSATRRSSGGLST